MNSAAPTAILAASEVECRATTRFHRDSLLLECLFEPAGAPSEAVLDLVALRFAGGASGLSWYALADTVAVGVDERSGLRELRFDRVAIADDNGGTREREVPNHVD